MTLTLYTVVLATRDTFLLTYIYEYLKKKIPNLRVASMFVAGTFKDKRIYRIISKNKTFSFFFCGTVPHRVSTKSVNRASCLW